jgi:Flp pilus assembly protein TadD
MKYGLQAWAASSLLLALAAVALAGPEANPPPLVAVEPTPAQKLKLALEWATMLERMDNLPEAAAQYERVLTMEENNAVAIHRLGIVFSKAGQFDRADQFFQRAVKLQPRDAAVWNDWGRSFYLRNNWVEAEKRYRQSLGCDAKYQLAVNNLAMTLGQEKRYSESFQTFCSAGLTEAQAHCNIAFILWSQGRVEEAKKACALAHQLDPSSRKAQELLAQLDPSQRPQLQRTSAPGTSVQGAQQPSSLASGVSTSARPIPLSTQPMVYADAAGQAPYPGPVSIPAPQEANPAPVYQSPNGTKWVPTH